MPAEVSKPTILVIEDNTDQWFIIRWALNERFSEVEPIWFADPAQAIIYLETCLEQSLDFPHLILLDLYLPREEIGLKTLHLMKKPEKLYSELPVVVLSQFGSSDTINACYAGGANSYLTKPLTPVDWLNCFALFRAYWWHRVDLPAIEQWAPKPRDQPSGPAPGSPSGLA